MNKSFFLYLLAMASVTYFIRMIPFTLVRKKITSVYIKSFLNYVPYAVLGAMTFPYIFYSTGNTAASTFATVSAFIMSYFNRPLIEVAGISCLTALIFGFIF